MQDDAKERALWKARLAHWIEGLTGPVSRPVRKLIGEVSFGILASGSLCQAAIARSLCEPQRLHHTQKRLSRMLARHSEVSWAAEALQLEHMAPRVSEDMVLALDPGDLNRDGAPSSEYRSRVRDGDRGEIVGGYPLVSVVARDPSGRCTLPLLTRVQTPQRPGHRSENTELLGVMEQVRSALSVDPLWVIDRGGDRGRLWAQWLADDWPVCVRAANQRYWLWRDQKRTAQQIARQLPMRHNARMRHSHVRTVRFGITTVRLPGYEDQPLSMVVVRHGRREPLVLVTTRAVRGRRQGERLIQAYLDRWACEEGYRFTKQGFDLEGVTARRFPVLQNLVALASLAWAMLAADTPRAEPLVAKARRQKPRRRPQFPFYTLLKGFQRLFAGAHHVFYHWWRRARPSTKPPIDDLFESNHALIPTRT